MTADIIQESPEYTPNTLHIRSAYYGASHNRDWEASRAAEFDRWLATHDAEVSRKALTDAATNWETPPPIGAPYDADPPSWLRGRAEQVGENHG